jgi:hypothetical protein
MTAAAANVLAMRLMHAHEVGAAGMIELDEDLLIHAENADVLPKLPDASFDLIYIDPPFNTGHVQRKRTVSTEHDEAGQRVGFGGRRYRTRLLTDLSFDDDRREYLDFIVPRLEHARRLLAVHGTLYLHLDYREAHYCKLALDEIFGRDCFLNEIVWAYDYGGQAKAAVAGEARHDPRLRSRRGPPPLRLRGGRARALHGARARDAREGSPREDARRHLVAHDRPDQRQGEDRLPDAEARGGRAAHRRGVLAPGRLVPRLLRGIWDTRRRMRSAGSTLRARRSQPERDRDRRAATGRRCARRVVGLDEGDPGRIVAEADVDRLDHRVARGVDDHQRARGVARHPDVAFGVERDRRRDVVALAVARAQGDRRRDLGEAVSITDTVSSLALVTYALEPSAVNAVFHGVLPTAIRPTVREPAVASTTTSSLLGVRHVGLRAVGRDRHSVRVAQLRGAF